MKFRQLILGLSLLIFIPISSASDNEYFRVYDNNDKDWIDIFARTVEPYELVIETSGTVTDLSTEESSEFLEGVKKQISVASEQRKKPGLVFGTGKTIDQIVQIGKRSQGRMPLWTSVIVGWDVDYRDSWPFNLVLIIADDHTGSEVTLRFSPERAKTLLDGLHGAVDLLEKQP